jgi:hypothetical protein
MRSRAVAPDHTVLIDVTLSATPEQMLQRPICFQTSVTLNLRYTIFWTMLMQYFTSRQSLHIIAFIYICSSEFIETDSFAKTLDSLLMSLLDSGISGKDL